MSSNAWSRGWRRPPTRSTKPRSPASSRCARDRCHRARQCRALGGCRRKPEGTRSIVAAAVAALHRRAREGGVVELAERFVWLGDDENARRDRHARAEQRARAEDRARADRAAEDGAL